MRSYFFSSLHRAAPSHLTKLNTVKLLNLLTEPVVTERLTIKGDGGYKFTALNCSSLKY